MDKELREQAANMKELSKHCFGPSCSLDSYEFLMQDPVEDEVVDSRYQEKRRVHPVDSQVRAMERQRQDLAKHCFGPACSLDMYTFLKDE